MSNKSPTVTYLGYEFSDSASFYAIPQHVRQTVSIILDRTLDKKGYSIAAQERSPETPPDWKKTIDRREQGYQKPTAHKYPNTLDYLEGEDTYIPTNF